MCILVEILPSLSPQMTKGHVDFVIKVYPTGRMSQFMDKLTIGEVMAFKGPKVKEVIDC